MPGCKKKKKKKKINFETLNFNFFWKMQLLEIIQEYNAKNQQSYNELWQHCMSGKLGTWLTQSVRKIELVLSLGRMFGITNLKITLGSKPQILRLYLGVRQVKKIPQKKDDTFKVIKIKGRNWIV